jgi:hypothetical protein
VVRLRALDAQCLGLLAVAAGAWNPISTWILYHLGPLFVARPLVGAGSSAGLKLQTPAPYAELALAAGLAVAVAGWRVHRCLASLDACLPAERVALELRDGLEHWFPPLSALLGTIGISLVFLHEQTAALLPLLLLIWLAPVGYWFLRRRGVAMRAATAQRG